MNAADTAPSPIPFLGASAINASAINASQPEMHSLRRKLRAQSPPRMQFLGLHKWIMYAKRDRETALFHCSQRDSAVMCISSLFLFRDASPSLFVQTNREYRAQPAANSSGRVTRARSTRRTYHPASVFFLVLLFFLRVTAPIFRPFPFFSTFSSLSNVYTCETKGFSSRYTKSCEFFY